jgi:hypothetical protein
MNKQQTLIRLTPAERTYLAAIGDGNMTQGIRSIMARLPDSPTYTSLVAFINQYGRDRLENDLSSQEPLTIHVLFHMIKNLGLSLDDIRTHLSLNQSSLGDPQ